MGWSSAQLRALRALAHWGSMSAAAEALGYTPGAVSQQIAALERVVGVDLVMPQGRGVRLTEAGLVLAEHAESLLAAEDAARQATRMAAGATSGRVTVGIFATTAAWLLPRVVGELSRRHPELTLSSREVDVDDASAAVRRGQVDVAFGLDYARAPIPRAPGIDLVPLTSEHFRLIVARDSSFVARDSSFVGRDSSVAERAAGRRRISLDAVADAAWVLPAASTYQGRAVRAGCRLAGFEPRVVHEITDTTASLAMVSTGLGVTLATPMMLDLASGLALVTAPVHDPVTRDVVLLVPRGERPRHAVDAVVQVARDVLSI